MEKITWLADSIQYFNHSPKYKELQLQLCLAGMGLFLLTCGVLYLPMVHLLLVFGGPDWLYEPLYAIHAEVGVYGLVFLCAVGGLWVLHRAATWAAGSDTAPAATHRPLLGIAACLLLYLASLVALAYVKRIEPFDHALTSSTKELLTFGLTLGQIVCLGIAAVLVITRALGTPAQEAEPPEAQPVPLAQARVHPLLVAGAVVVSALVVGLMQFVLPIPLYIPLKYIFGNLPYILLPFLAPHLIGTTLLLTLVLLLPCMLRRIWLQFPTRAFAVIRRCIWVIVLLGITLYTVGYWIKQPKLDTALLYYISHGKEISAFTMLVMGADCDATDINGIPALSGAITKKVEWLTRALLHCYPNMHLAEPNAGLAPIHYATTDGSPETIQLLLHCGANLEQESQYGLTPIFTAVGEKRAEIVEYLLRSGANSNHAAHGGETPLHFTTRYGDEACLRVLLEHQGDLEAGDQYGYTPLHYAVTEGELRMARLMLEAGANVTARNRWGSTPLHAAVRAGHTEMVSLLLQHGANPAMRDNHGITPLDEARKRKDVEIIEILGR